MRVEKAEKRAHRYNEDRIIIGADYCMVLDGATPLYKNIHKPTDAAYFVQQIKTNLKPSEKDIKAKLKEISVKLYDTFLQDGNEEGNMPSCGIAYAEVSGDSVAVNTIGDCEAAVRLQNGDVVRILQSELPALDNKALTVIKETAKTKNIDVKEAVSICSDILIANRSLINKPQGYAAFTPSPYPDFCCRTEIFKINEVEELYLYSDGITQAFDELRICTFDELFSRSVDLQAIIRRITQRALSDKNYNSYPRFKLLDDISIIKIKF